MPISVAGAEFFCSAPFGFFALVLGFSREGSTRVFGGVSAFSLKILARLTCWSNEDGVSTFSFSGFPSDTPAFVFHD